jgi:phage baseplate assembly protein gpV
MLNFNLQSGDLGWVVANDRDISLFLTSYAQSPPNTTRLHDFADGLFIPDVMTGYTIASEDVSNAVLQSLDGTVKISFNSAQIKIQAPAVIIEGATTVDGALTATAGITVTGGGSTPFNVTGDMLLTGNLRVVGNITASGDITPFVP